MVDFEYRDVEGATSEVEDQDGLVLILVHAIGEGGRSGLVDYPEDFEAGDAAGVLRGLPLCVGEVGRACDNCLTDFPAEVLLCIRLHLLEDECGDLLGGVVIVIDLLAPISAHLPLDGEYCPLGVGHRLALRGDSHQPLAVLGEGHYARCSPRALRVGYHHRLPSLEGGHAAVGSSKVNSDYRSAHSIPPMVPFGLTPDRM